MAAAVAAALFAPPMAALQAAAGVLLTPVSHPSSLAGNTVAGWFEGDDDRGREGRDDDTLLRENLALRQQNERLHGQLVILQKLNADRANLGQSLRPLTTPAAITGGIEADSNLLAVAAAADLPTGRPVLGVDRGVVGLVGTVDTSLGRIARVRLTTDPDHRPFGGRLVTYDEDARLVDADD